MVELWANWSAEWKRQKTYLIRSLFEDRRNLSQLQETNETISASRSQSAASSGSSSPLPDLIIEIEKNKHDDPEEVYELLKKKMAQTFLQKAKLRAYCIGENIAPAIDYTKPLITATELQTNKESSYNKNENILNKTFEISPFNQSDRALETSSIHVTNEVMETQADIHTEAVISDAEDNSYNAFIEHQGTPSYAESSPILIPRGHIMFKRGSVSEQHALRQARNDRNSSQDIAEEDSIELSPVECMRRQQMEISPVQEHSITGIIPKKLTFSPETEKDIPHPGNFTYTIDSIDTGEDDINHTSGITETAREQSAESAKELQNKERDSKKHRISDAQSNVTGTLPKKICKHVATQTIKNICKDVATQSSRRICKDVSTQSSRTICKDVATQSSRTICKNGTTQTVVEKVSWEVLKSNFFHGTPRVYTLNRC